MKTTKIKELTDALKRIDGLKKEISQKRDELRSAVMDIDDILGSLDDACDDLSEGQRSFERAVEALSQYL